MDWKIEHILTINNLILFVLSVLKAVVSKASRSRVVIHDTWHVTHDHYKRVSDSEIQKLSSDPGLASPMVKGLTIHIHSEYPILIILCSFCFVKTNENKLI